MRPTDILRNEHRLIEKILGVLEAMANDTEWGPAPQKERVGDLLTFLREFADRCHHGKEEKHLFQSLERYGFGADQGPVAVMLYEHEEGRGYIREMGMALEIAGDEGRKRFAQAARSYVTLLSGHIMKEEHVLFPLADQVLSEADQQAVAEGFEQVESVEMGEGAHERFHALADQLIAAGRA